jgi:hypothetical protein
MSVQAGPTVNAIDGTMRTRESIKTKHELCQLQQPMSVQ